MIPSQQLIPEMPTGQWKTEHLEQVWQYAWWFLKEHQMWIMLVVAICVATAVTGIILSLFTKDEDEDDDDFEVRRI